MSYRPSVSVIIPTFNRVRQVQTALKSVVEQTYPEWEAIVVDDGSIDGTETAFQRIISEQNGRGRQIRYFLQPNQGPSAARNKGISEACGVWIAFLDSDDVWLPEKLEWQVRAIEQFKTRCSACITDARLVDTVGKYKTAFQENGRHYQEIIGMDPDAAQSLVMSREPFWVSNLL